jgi:CHASE1-domain containing sensor protein
MRNADRIRSYGQEKYVLPARQRKHSRFSIRVGDVVSELKLNGRAPAVCSALKTREFLQSNDLRLVETSGPKSGQSTTVIYTYEFVGTKQSSPQPADSWARLRGALKDVFTELGGGEAYLRAERSNFYPAKEDE